MAGTEEPHFSKTVLDLSERTHQAIGHSKVGKAVTKAITGSPYPGYRQLDWYSRGVTSEVKSTIKVPGDPHAGIVPRFWNRAAIMAMPRSDIRKVEQTRDLLPPSYKEAVAYISDDVVHVGTMATESFLFELLNKEERATAMRLGKGPLEATMGLWIPKERHFISFDNVRVVEPAVFVSSLPQDYPGLALT